MENKVYIIGAGPGAPDLITVRGARLLAQADVVIYAGSLVNEALLELAPHATFFNSAKMSLDEVLTVVENHFRAGRRVVRLHTGDPAIYGAVAEQYRELDARGIPYEVVPGVSSVFAAAAALKAELTMPGVSQTVILTREAGRTPVPAGEELTGLAAHGATLCLYLSIADLAGLAARLIAAGRAPDTAVAVVYRASWPNEKIVRGTLADIAGRVEEAGVLRQAMVVIGDVLRREGELSRLYAADFTTGYRHGTMTRGFRGRVALFGLTRQALLKAGEIASGMDEATVFAPEKFADAVPLLRRRSYADGAFGATLAEAWREFDALVLVMASGIAVRHLAGLTRDKATDPAVVVCDEAGRHAVSLLGGHLGGGNELARDVARITGGEAVITTASDVRQLPAFDELAKRYHYRIGDKAALTRIAAAVLTEAPVEVLMPRGIFDAELAGSGRFCWRGEAADGAIEVRSGDTVLTLVRNRYSLGIGCRRGVSAARLEEVVTRVLGESGFTLDDVAEIASAEPKAMEPGLLEFARKYERTLHFFAADRLNQVTVPHPSAAAARHLGIESVSEAAALLAAGAEAELVIPKTAAGDVTVALAGRRIL